MMEQQVEVIVQRPNQADRRLVLGVGITHLGRAEDNELPLADIGVSRRHARVTIDATSVMVEDMGSGNGTYFRGQRLDRQILQDGDQIYVDPFTLVFRITRRSAAVRNPSNEVAQRPEPPTPTTPPPPVVALASLVTLAGHRLNPTYPLRDGTLTLGRSEGRDITLFDPSTSRLQTSITWRDGAWWVVDEKSANGSWVNGERISEHRLLNGDVLRLGATEFRFESADRAHAAAPATVAPAARATTDSVKGRAPDAPRVPEPARQIDKMLLEPTHMTPLITDPVDAVVVSPTRILPVTRTPPVVHPQSQTRLLVPIALFGFAGAALTIAAGAFWYALHLGRPPSAEVAPTVLVAAPLAPDVERLMGEGRDLLEKRDYMNALSRFHQALKLAPENSEAQRMAYLTCTLRTVDALRGPLVTPKTTRSP